jgi:uncharacterized SAM-binding protein YcdF (DUF218 family)
VFFYVKKIIGALVLPPTGALLLAIGGLLLLRRKPRAGRALAWTGVLMLLAFTLPPVSSALTALICDSGPVDLREASSAQAIVVLGGGLRRDAVEYGGDTLNWLSLERVRYGAALARATGLPVLVTGGSVSGGRPEAEVMRDALAREFGIQVRWAEAQSRNTHENAVFSSVLLRRDGISKVVLVAHGVDIRRARREFTAAGIEVVPAPTSIPSVGIDNPLQLLPSASALQGSYLALYELLGNIATTLHLSRS